MRKKYNIVIIIILIIVAYKVGNNIVKDVKRKEAERKYDYIIVGNNCQCQSWADGKCKYSYGIKDGVVKELDESFPRDLSNIYDANNFDEKYIPIYEDIKKLIDKGDGKYFNIIRFIVSKNNYYVLAYVDYDESVYKYIKDENKLELLIHIKTCDLDYFYEK